MIVAQFIVGGITARIFSPEVFGGFAAALSLQAIFTMASTTGVPSYVLMRPELSRGDLFRLRCWTLTGAVTTAALLWLTLPAWLNLLRAGEVPEFRTLLALTQLIAPSASLEMALVRRQRRAAYDAAVYGGAGVAGLGASAWLAITTGAPQALVVAPLLAAVLALPSAIIAQGKFRMGETSRPALQTPREVGRYLASVSGLNGIHFAIAQIPIWVLSIGFGARILGFYSRASTLTGAAANGIGTSLLRAVQPYWRDRAPGDALDRALSDALRVSTGISFPFFAVVAVLAPDIFPLWLGPGWEIAGKLAIPLSLAGAFQIPYMVISNAFELRAWFRPIRDAQLVMLGVGALGAVATSLGAPAIVVVSIFASIPASGLVWLIGASRGRVDAPRLASWSELATSTWWATSVALASLIGLRLASHWDLTLWGSANAASLAVGATSAGVAALALVARHPALLVIKERRRRADTS